MLEVLAGALEALRTPALPGLPPLTGGLVGALGWEVARHWEPTLPYGAPDELGVPELTLCLATDLAAVDHLDGSVWLIANAINFDGTDERVDEAYADAVRRLDAMQACAHEPTAHSPAGRARRARARARVPHHARGLRELGQRGQGGDPRRRGVPGGGVPAPGPGLPGRPAGRVPRAAHAQPEPVHVLPAAPGPRRPGLRRGRVQPRDPGPGRGRAGCSRTRSPARGRAARRPGRTPSSPRSCWPTPRSAPSTSCSSTCPATTWSRCASRPASRSSSSWRCGGSATSCTSARRWSGGCEPARRRWRPWSRPSRPGRCPVRPSRARSR